MPTLTELLADIDLRYPNTFTDGQKVYWINRILGKYYKYAPLEKEVLVMLTSGVSDYLASSSDGFMFENLNYVKFFNTKDDDSTGSTATATTNVNSTTILENRASYKFTNESSVSLYILPTTVTLTTNKNGTTVPSSGTVYFLSAATNLQTFSSVAGGAGFEIEEIHLPINSTDREEYILYGRTGLKESHANDHLYDSSGALGIFPTPTTSGQLTIVNYYKFPDTLTTNGLTVTPDMDEKYQDIIVHATINIIAKSGINPDIDIANNAQADLEEVLNQARMEKARRRKRVLNRNNISYREGWNSGSDFVSSSS